MPTPSSGEGAINGSSSGAEHQAFVGNKVEEVKKQNLDKRVEIHNKSEKAGSELRTAQKIGSLVTDLLIQSEEIRIDKERF